MSVRSNTPPHHTPERTRGPAAPSATGNFVKHLPEALSVCETPGRTNDTYTDMPHRHHQSNNNNKDYESGTIKRRPQGSGSHGEAAGSTAKPPRPSRVQKEETTTSHATAIMATTHESAAAASHEEATTRGSPRGRPPRHHHRHANHRHHHRKRTPHRSRDSSSNGDEDENSKTDAVDRRALHERGADDVQPTTEAQSVHKGSGTMNTLTPLDSASRRLISPYEELLWGINRATQDTAQDTQRTNEAAKEEKVHSSSSDSKTRRESAEQRRAKEEEQEKDDPAATLSHPHLTPLDDLLAHKVYTEEDVLLELEALRQRGLRTTAPFNRYILPILAWYTLRDKFGEAAADKYVTLLQTNEQTAEEKEEDSLRDGGNVNESSQEKQHADKAGKDAAAIVKNGERVDKKARQRKNGRDAFPASPTNPHIYPQKQKEAPSSTAKAHGVDSARALPNSFLPRVNELRRQLRHLRAERRRHPVHHYTITPPQSPHRQTFISLTSSASYPFTAATSPSATSLTPFSTPGNGNNGAAMTSGGRSPRRLQPVFNPIDDVDDDNGRGVPASLPVAPRSDAPRREFDRLAIYTRDVAQAERQEDAAEENSIVEVMPIEGEHARESNAFAVVRKPIEKEGSNDNASEDDNNKKKTSEVNKQPVQTADMMDEVAAGSVPQLQGRRNSHVASPFTQTSPNTSQTQQQQIPAQVTPPSREPQSKENSRQMDSHTTATSSASPDASSITKNPSNTNLYHTHPNKVNRDESTFYAGPQAHQLLSLATTTTTTAPTTTTTHPSPLSSKAATETSTPALTPGSNTLRGSGLRSNSSSALPSGPLYDVQSSLSRSSRTPDDRHNEARITPTSASDAQTASRLTSQSTRDDHLRHGKTTKREQQTHRQSRREHHHERSSSGSTQTPKDGPTSQGRPPLAKSRLNSNSTLTESTRNARSESITASLNTTQGTADMMSMLRNASVTTHKPSDTLLIGEARASQLTGYGSMMGSDPRLATINSANGTQSNLGNGAGGYGSMMGSDHRMSAMNSANGTQSNLGNGAGGYGSMMGSDPRLATMNSANGTQSNLGNGAGGYGSMMGSDPRLATMNSANGTQSNLGNGAGGYGSMMGSDPRLATMNSANGTQSNLGNGAAGYGSLANVMTLDVSAVRTGSGDTYHSATDVGASGSLIGNSALPTPTVSDPERHSDSQKNSSDHTSSSRTLGVSISAKSVSLAAESTASSAFDPRRLESALHQLLQTTSELASLTRSVSRSQDRAESNNAGNGVRVGRPLNVSPSPRAVNGSAGTSAEAATSNLTSDHDDNNNKGNEQGMEAEEERGSAHGVYSALQATINSWQQDKEETVAVARGGAGQRTAVNDEAGTSERGMKKDTRGQGGYEYSDYNITETAEQHTNTATTTTMKIGAGGDGHTTTSNKTVVTSLVQDVSGPLSLLPPVSILEKNPRFSPQHLQGNSPTARRVSHVSVFPSVSVVEAEEAQAGAPYSPRTVREQRAQKDEHHATPGQHTVPSAHGESMDMPLDFTSNVLGRDAVRSRALPTGNASKVSALNAMTRVLEPSEDEASGQAHMPQPERSIATMMVAPSSATTTMNATTGRSSTTAQSETEVDSNNGGDDDSQSRSSSSDSSSTSSSYSSDDDESDEALYGRGHDGDAKYPHATTLTANSRTSNDHQHHRVPGHNISTAAIEAVQRRRSQLAARMQNSTQTNTTTLMPTTTTTTAMTSVTDPTTAAITSNNTTNSTLSVEEVEEIEASRMENFYSSSTRTANTTIMEYNNDNNNRGYKMTGAHAVPVPATRRSPLQQQQPQRRGRHTVLDLSNVPYVDSPEASSGEEQVDFVRKQRAHNHFVAQWARRGMMWRRQEEYEAMCEEWAKQPQLARQIAMTARPHAGGPLPFADYPLPNAQRFTQTPTPPVPQRATVQTARTARPWPSPATAAVRGKAVAPITRMPGRVRR